MNACRLAGARREIKSAIGDELPVVLERDRVEGLLAGGKTVKVCEVEVMEELVLPVAAIVSRVC